MSEWVYWGLWRQQLLFASGYFTFRKSEVVKCAELELSGNFMSLAGHFFYEQETLDTIKNRVEESFEKNDEWFENIFAYCEMQIKKMNEIKSVTELFDSYNEFLCTGGMIEMLDLAVEDIMAKKCESLSIAEHEIRSLLFPARKTLLMEFLSAKKTDEMIENNKWIGTHAFEGEPLTKEHALDMHESSAIEKSNIPKSFERLVQVGREMVYYRSQLMEVVDRKSFSFWVELESKAKVHDLTLSQITQLTVWEMQEFLREGSLPDNIKERSKNCGIIENGDVKVILEDETHSLLSQIRKEQNEGDELTGRIAYPGIVRGVAKIVLEPQDMKKVNKGDILIASETQPDYIHAMGRAAAFVTDNGGITCHAAVVAREMKKPCVIGTGRATGVLKDGDLVEVDANNGVVRKL